MAEKKKAKKSAKKLPPWLTKKEGVPEESDPAAKRKAKLEEMREKLNKKKSKKK